jgi:hypothetical protein
MPEFTIEGLERAIEAAKTNIQVFEDAIDGERATIKKCRKMMMDADRKAAERKSVKPDDDQV